MKRQLMAIGTSIALCVALLSGCSGQTSGENTADAQASEQSQEEGKSNSNATTKENGEQIKIAWIGKTLNNPWWNSVADFAQREADALGIELQKSLPDEEVDLEKQVNMIESAIQKKVDAIVISAASSDGILPALQKARDADIKIVNFDTRISDPAMYDAFVGGSDEGGAYKAGKYICEQLNGEGEVAVITGLMAQSTGVDRYNGFMRACEEYPNIKVVAEPGAEWRSDLAASATESLLIANPNVKAIFACNDQMAQGMVSAVQAKGIAPDDLILVGFDGILEAGQLVLNGDLDAFVALPNIDEGMVGVRLATALVLQPEYEYHREMIYPTPLVTKDFIEGHSDYTIYEYMAERFPLYGVSDRGY